MQTRREFLAGASVVVGAAFVGGPVRAQTKTVDGWPLRHVNVIATSGTSGPSGNFRLYADQLQGIFGKPFVLEGVPGASGAIGLNRVLREESDGQTLLVSTNSALVLAPLVVENFGVSLDQFEPISLLFRFRFVLLANSLIKVRTLEELVKHAQENPGTLQYGSPGKGTGGHLVSGLMVKRTGIDALHVPYSTASQQMMDAAGGTLSFTFDSIGNSRGLVESGKLVPLAVTGPSRAEAAPDIPTFAELGYPGFENLFVSVGLLAKRGVSPAVVTALNAEISKMNEAGTIVDTLKGQAYEVVPGSPQDYAASLAADHATWSSIAKEVGVAIKA